MPVIFAAAFAALVSLALAGFSPPSGAVDPRVTPANLASTVCAAGYTRTVRPPSRYTGALKRRQLAAAGIDPRRARRYEEDHLIPLELGGDARDARNLWPQPWDGAEGARRKDRLENRLHRLVCSGRLDLRAAQRAIAADWRAAARLYLGPAQFR